MARREQKIIKRAIFLGISYPVLAIMFAPIGLMLFGRGLDYFSADFSMLTNICWYIYFLPCLIGFGITRLLVPTEFTYLRIMTFFITQIMVYYAIGWIIARLVCSNKKALPKALPESNENKDS